MKFTSPDPITNFESERIAADFRAIVDDSALNTSVTYSHFSSSSFDAQTGATTTTTTDDSVSTVVSTVGARQRDRLGGDVEVGDRMYLFDEADFSWSMPPTTQDEITEGSVVRQVVAWHDLALVPGVLIVAREA